MYVEVFPLRDLDRTLTWGGWVLIGLRLIAASFNDMAEAVQARIAHERRFSAHVSHELRSPLTSVLGTAELLDGRCERPPEREAGLVTVLVQQVRRMSQMLLDLLEISRINADDPTQWDSADLAALCREVVAQRGLDPTLVAGDAPVVRTDARRLERIIGNLVDNAQRHGGGLVQVLLQRDASALRILVVYAGPGIDEGIRERLFEPFARGASGGQTEGAGLGLAIVREQALALGGDVTIEPHPPVGRGSSLPCPSPRRAHDESPGFSVRDLLRRCVVPAGRLRRSPVVKRRTFAGERDPGAIARSRFGAQRDPHTVPQLRSQPDTFAGDHTLAASPVALAASPVVRPGGRTRGGGVRSARRHLSVAPTAPSRSTPGAGPTAGAASGPPTVAASTAPSSVTVRLSPAFTPLPPVEQVLLLGQVVLSLTGAGERSVAFTDDAGKPLAVPLPDGRLLDAPATARGYNALIIRPQRGTLSVRRFTPRSRQVPSPGVRP